VPPRRKRKPADEASGTPARGDTPALDITTVAELTDVLRPVMRAIAESVGPHCEVVLHDLSERRLEHTIAAIENGHVTGRTVGGPSTNLGLELLREEARDHDEFGYVARTGDGRELRCSVVYLRGADGCVVAAFAVNVDLTPMQAARNSLDRLLPSREAPRLDETFATDIAEVLDQLIEAAVASTGKTVALMDRTDRMQVMRFLDAKGAFFVKRAVDRVARRLGVSRVTAYNYLERLRGEGQTGKG